MKKLLLLCIIFLAFCTQANSAIVDWTVTLTGDAFKDETSELVWLDIDTYKGKSYNEVQTLLPTGFSIATGDQMIALMTSINGMPNKTFDDLAPIIGQVVWANNYYMYGFFNDGDDPEISIYYWIGNSPSMSFFLLSDDKSGTTKDTKVGPMGAWVVQDISSVPIPSSLLLLGFGLAGIGIFGRKKFKN